jgi:DNA-directed RNA polymerase beta' subunit
MTIIANQGFSIGISDVTPGKRLRDIKDQSVRKAYEECDDVIAQYKSGKLETMAGCNEEQTMEVNEAQGDGLSALITHTLAIIVYGLRYSLRCAW